MGEGGGMEGVKVLDYGGWVKEVEVDEGVSVLGYGGWVKEVEVEKGVKVLGYGGWVKEVEVEGGVKEVEVEGVKVLGYGGGVKEVEVEAGVKMLVYGGWVKEVEVEGGSMKSMDLSSVLMKLNTSPELYHILARALDAGVIDSEEANLVGRMLRVDFERGGIHLPDEKRAKVEQLTNTITALGMEFQKNIVEEKQEVDVFPASRLRAVPAPVSAMLRPIVRLSDGTVMLASARERTSGLGKKGSDFGARMSPAECGLRVSTDQVILSAILKWVPDAQVRRDIFIAGHSTPKKNLAVLENLIATRHELAELLGFPSFAHYMVQPLVARSPDAILKFLHELSDKLRPKAEEELKLLMECKQSTKPESDIHAWDRAFYNGLVKARTYNLDARTVAAYFSLQGCLSGLSLLTKSLFGVELREIQMPPGEAWAPDIMKLALSHDTEGDLGYIYLDLYPRPNKYPHAAHFTLRCGRRISESEYQLPVVALVCNFPRPLAASPSLLGHGELETLFHEFGHALHSLLSRTEFQHLSGTRAALDFVETPSNLMEYFAWDYRLLSRFARHYSTNDVIPEVMVNAIRQSKLMSSATDMQTQAQEEQWAAILKERKEEKELLKQAKLKAIAEEQGAKKKLEEEMMRLQEEEEEKRRDVEEAAAEEEEALEGLLRRRTGERGQSSGTKEEDLWMEKKISEWVANLSLGEDEEVVLYVPREEKQAIARELEAMEDPLDRQTLEDEKRLEWKLHLAREKKRRREEANRMAKEVERIQSCKQEVGAQQDIPAKLDKILSYLEILGQGWTEQCQANKGQEVTLHSIRTGFREFARDVVTHIGTEVKRLKEGAERLCAGAIEGAKVVATTEAETRPRKEPVKLKFPDSGKRTMIIGRPASTPFALLVRKEQLEEPVFVAYIRPVTEPREDTPMDPTIAKLLEEFKDLAESPTGVVPRPIQHRIDIEPGSRTPKGAVYRMSPRELEELRKQLDELLEKGWIRPSSSPFGAPLLFVPKKEGELRMCIGYRGLNAITVKNVEPLPRINDLLDRVQSYKYFSKIRLKVRISSDRGSS
ncbi:hypothetical protein CBR_g38873 [Chara braunii]|uniref:Peptidase M3A/M3B catalytic domain-containing protein n=1 Tax=Chara braunii TaxID=69332 RepID=A0A388LQH1_CHABU|nr:hypothetical protein CBR_g38873 [Chara braunii]|eukprot:GBG84590.1 hypothetical protein CBR_g38873 [Chara braunii]